jgi:hypothetical protein
MARQQTSMICYFLLNATDLQCVAINALYKLTDGLSQNAESLLDQAVSLNKLPTCKWVENE